MHYEEHGEEEEEEEQQHKRRSGQVGSKRGRDADFTPDSAERRIAEEDDAEDEEFEEEQRPKKAPRSQPKGIRPASSKPPSRSKRFKYEAWTDAETDLVIDLYHEVRPGLRVHPGGTWKDMKEKGGHMLLSRTPQDIRDKIRNLIKSGKVQQLEDVPVNAEDPIVSPCAALFLLGVPHATTHGRKLPWSQEHTPRDDF